MQDFEFNYNNLSGFSFVNYLMKVDVIVIV